jgi:ABC-type antimicrobial peptide transport system permease subunit
MTVRGKIDSEITKNVGKWFSVSDLQKKLKVENSTLKPLIMRYARDQILVRRKVKGEARAVQFSPAAKNVKEFQNLMNQYMPYKTSGKKIVSKNAQSSKTASSKASSKSLKSSSKKSSSKVSSKKSSSKKSSKR